MTIKQILKDINKKEWLFVGLVACLVILITAIPYVYGYLKDSVDNQFLGIVLINKVDYFNYFSYIEQAREGNFLFEDYYTTEPQPRIILNLFFLGLGLVAKFLNISAVSVWHLARLFSTLGFIFCSYLFASYIFKEKIKRKLCLLLVCFSGGIEFLFSPLARPFVFVCASTIFLDLTSNALFVFSTTLIILIFFLLLLGLENKKYKYSWWAGLTGLILFQIHPYDIPVVSCVLFVFWLIISLKQKRFDWFFFKSGLIFCLISSPAIIYYLYLMTSHWLTVARIDQAQIVGIGQTKILQLIIGFGLLCLFSLIGFFHLLSKKGLTNCQLFLLVWLVIQFALGFFPFALQIKLLEGFHLVLCFLSVFGMFFVYQKLKNIVPRLVFLFKNNLLLIINFFILFCFSNFFVLFLITVFAALPEISIPRKVIASMTWLRNNSLKNSAILCPNYLDIDGLIPAFAVRKTYTGHGIETINSSDKKTLVDWFFNENGDDLQKQLFLKKNNLDYVFYVKNIYGFNPEEKDYLRKVFENDLTAIYKIL